MTMTWHRFDRAMQSMMVETFGEEDQPFIRQALEDKTCVTRKSVVGKPRYDAATFDEAMAAAGGFPFWRNDNYVAFAFPRAVVTRVQGQSTTTVTVRVSDATVLEALVGHATAWLEPVAAADQPPTVYSFGKEYGSYTVREVGPVEGVLHRANYGAAVLRDYDRTLAQLQSRTPSGRLVLMEGEPGTGKTHLIRALIAALGSRAKCILIPPSSMADLAGPEFLQALMGQRAAKVPLVLILEDADDCLIARETNAAAKASLSALLNLSDGILGAALDLRVIATTNQTLDAIDKAVMRPGRLLAHLKVGALSPSEASACFRSLTGHDRSYTKPRTLAEVYEDSAAPVANGHATEALA